MTDMVGLPNYVDLLSSLHMMRDGEAVTNLSDIFVREFDRADWLFNLPPKVFGWYDESKTMRSLDVSDPGPDMDEGDLIVQATRFPLSDDQEDSNHAVIRSDSVTESAISESLECFFKYLARDAVILSDEVADICKRQESEYRAVQFSVRGDWRKRRIAGMAVRAGNVDNVDACHRCPELEGSWSLGYLVFLPSVGKKDGPKGPAFLNAFSSHGTGTFLWSMYVKQMLAQQVREVVDAGRRRLLVYRFYPNLPGTTRPSHYSAASGARAEPLVDVTLPD